MSNSKILITYDYIYRDLKCLLGEENQATKHHFHYYIHIYITTVGKDGKSKCQKMLNFPRSCGMAEIFFLYMSTLLLEYIFI